MPRSIHVLLLCLTCAAPGLGQEIYDAALESGADVRGGVVSAEHPQRVVVETSQLPLGSSVRVVWTHSDWTETHSSQATWVRNDAGPHGNNAEWRAEIGPFPNGRTVEYYVEATTPEGGRRGFNSLGADGASGGNFILYAWNGQRAPAPAQPGQVVEIPLEQLRSSQGWLHRHRGSYDPHDSFYGEPRIPLVYWVNWVAEPYWALANDGNHRTFDAVRQGHTTIQAKVVDRPLGWTRWPAKFKFLDSPVYADDDLQRRHPIGTARDFRGVDAQAEGFARAGRTTHDAARVDPGEAQRLFERVRAGALATVEAQLAAADAAHRAELLTLRHRLRALTLTVEPGQAVLAERQGSRIRIGAGLLAELEARGRGLPADARAGFGARALGLILAHEVAHATGAKAERLADARALEILARTPGVGLPRPAEVQAAVDAFARPGGTSALRALGRRLQSLVETGLTPAQRARLLEAMVRGEAIDPLADYRRGDGTLRWKALARDRVLHEAGGLAKFGLALFFKELATTAATGDRARIEAFFDGLTEVGFYQHYGLFVAGARVGEVAYGRFLQRHVRPRFVRSLLRTQVSLAAGLALPQLVDGTFETRTFAISLGSLGLSSAAVHAGASRLPWVKRLHQGQGLARLGRARLLARAGGFVYQAAELAVVLFLAEEIDERVNGWLDARAARRDLAAAGVAFLEAAHGGETDLAMAADRYHEAWTAYRDFLYRPLLAAELRLTDELAELAREGKRVADQRARIPAAVGATEALRDALIAEHGSLEAYAASLTAARDATLGARVDDALANYNAARAADWERIYQRGQRGADYLAELPAARARELLRAGDADARRALERALADLSANRLETYDDELAVLQLAQSLGAAPATLETAAARVQATRELDQQLATGLLPALPPR